MHEINSFKSNLLFENLSELHFKNLISISTEKNFRKGEIIIHEEDIDENLYFVLSGKLEIFKKEKISGQEHQIYQIKPGMTIRPLA